MSEAEPHLLSEFDLKGRHILLADDDRLNTRLLSGMLDSEGGKTAAVKVGCRPRYGRLVEGPAGSHDHREIKRNISFEQAAQANPECRKTT
jgi:CheY-like chemotaxis protein